MISLFTNPTHARAFVHCMHRDKHRLQQLLGFANCKSAILSPIFIFPLFDSSFKNKFSYSSFAYVWIGNPLFSDPNENEESYFAFNYLPGVFVEKISIPSMGESESSLRELFVSKLGQSSAR